MGNDEKPVEMQFFCSKFLYWLDGIVIRRSWGCHFSFAFPGVVSTPFFDDEIVHSQDFN